MHIEVITRKSESNVGHKTPILCVHGGYHGAWCWDEHFLPYFAKAGFDAYALSLRGHGQSDGYENINRWRTADYVMDVTKAVRDSHRSAVDGGDSGDPLLGWSSRCASAHD